MNKNDFLSATWLNGKYNKVNGFRVEVNTSLSYIYFEDISDQDNTYYYQGEEADKVIDEINYIYNIKGVTAEEAIGEWINVYLC